MLMEQARKDIVTYGNRMIADRLTVGTAGNISIFDPETGLMAISPSGIPYADTKPEDIVIMDLNDRVVEGTRKPSSEHSLHAVFYKTRKDARAVVHAHSMFCTTLTCTGIDLQSVHYAIADAGCPTLPTVPYRVYGSPELAGATAEVLKNTESRALLLANHGMIAFGDSIKGAYGLALTCEWCAEVQWRSMAIGTPHVLTDDQMAEVIEHYKSYGQVAADGSHPHGYNG